MYLLCLLLGKAELLMSCLTDLRLWSGPKKYRTIQNHWPSPHAECNIFHFHPVSLLKLPCDIDGGWWWCRMWKRFIKMRKNVVGASVRMVKGVDLLIWLLRLMVFNTFQVINPQSNTFLETYQEFHHSTYFDWTLTRKIKNKTIFWNSSGRILL